MLPGNESYCFFNEVKCFFTACLLSGHFYVYSGELFFIVFWGEYVAVRGRDHCLS